MASVIRVSAVGHYAPGQVTVNDFHYNDVSSATLTEGDCVTIANDMYTKWGTQYRALMESSWTLDDIVVRTEVLPPDVAVSGSHPVALAGTYTVSARQNPHGLCVAIQKKTGFASRSGRGWVLIPGSPLTSDLQIDNWGSSYISSCQTFANLLDDVVTSAPASTSWFPVVYSRTRRKRGQSPYTFDITRATAQYRVHYLKTRVTIP